MTPARTPQCAIEVRHHSPWPLVRCHGLLVHAYSQFHSRRYSLRITLKYTTLVRMRSGFYVNLHPWQRSGSEERPPIAYSCLLRKGKTPHINVVIQPCVSSGSFFFISTQNWLIITFPLTSTFLYLVWEWLWLYPVWLVIRSRDKVFCLHRL